MNELRDKYVLVYGEPTRAGNRPWLIKKIAWRLQALAEGNLSECARRRAAELADGGFSGDNTDRPALQQLLADIRAGKVDLVEVHRVRGPVAGQ